MPKNITPRNNTNAQTWHTISTYTKIKIPQVPIPNVQNYHTINNVEAKIYQCQQHTNIKTYQYCPRKYQCQNMSMAKCNAKWYQQWKIQIPNITIPTKIGAIKKYKIFSRRSTNEYIYIYIYVTVMLLHLRCCLLVMVYNAWCLVPADCWLLIAHCCLVPIVNWLLPAGWYLQLAVGVRCPLITGC